MFPHGAAIATYPEYGHYIYDDNNMNRIHIVITGWVDIISFCIRYIFCLVMSRNRMLGSEHPLL